MHAWYLVQTKPRQELLAKNNLERQGYTVYLPLIQVKRRRRGKISHENGSMFPLYLFIHLREGTDNWAPVRSTLGVSKMVMFGQIPARVPDNLIEILKCRVDANGVQILPERKLNTGDHVRITEGPFEGYEAVIYAKTAGERTVLLLKAVENFLKVELDSHSIEPLDQ